MRVRVAPAALTATALAPTAPLADTAAAAPAADPTEFVVDTASDAVDADPSDGRCRTTSGECSLRAAVTAANARPGRTATLSPGHDRLTIPPGPRLIIGDHPDPTTRDLNVDAPTTIQGTGARSTVIDANHLDRAFRLRVNTHISDVKITGGRAKQRDLPLTDTGDGGIADAGHLTLRRVAVTGNSAGYGGGVLNSPDSHLDLVDSTVRRNAAGEAGGIGFDDSDTVTNSTIADNRLTNPGGYGGYGGSIDIRGLGAVQILNSIITRSSSSDGGDAINIASAYLDSLPAPIPDIIDLPLARTTLRSSVVAGNTVDCAGADCQKAFAAITSLRHNIDGDGSCRLSAAGDLPSRDPLVGPPANHGRPTDTVALLPGSPARDAAKGCPAADQRGVSRPQDATCDIGAYEHTP
ncbi:choice-of-anchor Q domain-containing protein [Streptomyces massasporeus]